MKGQTKKHRHGPKIPTDLQSRSWRVLQTNQPPPRPVRPETIVLRDPHHEVLCGVQPRGDHGRKIVGRRVAAPRLAKNLRLTKKPTNEWKPSGEHVDWVCCWFQRPQRHTRWRQTKEIMVVSNSSTASTLSTGWYCRKLCLPRWTTNTEPLVGHNDSNNSWCKPHGAGQRALTLQPVGCSLC